MSSYLSKAMQRTLVCLLAVMAILYRQGDLKYTPGGTARTNNNYFRYSYRDNGKMKHVHIPGGNTSSPFAQMHWEEVQRLVRSGASPKYIVQTIKNWSS